MGVFPECSPPQPSGNLTVFTFEISVLCEWNLRETIHLMWYVCRRPTRKVSWDASPSASFLYVIYWIISNTAAGLTHRHSQHLRVWTAHVLLPWWACGWHGCWPWCRSRRERARPESTGNSWSKGVGWLRERRKERKRNQITFKYEEIQQAEVFRFSFRGHIPTW